MSWYIDGTADNLRALRSGGVDIPLRTDAANRLALVLPKESPLDSRLEIGTDDAGDLVLSATLANNTAEEQQLGEVGLRLGIDTEMKSYPQWDSIFFPTLLRCELDRFWGYLMRPTGEILALSCDAPVSAWRLNYSHGSFDLPERGPRPAMTVPSGGHRIEGITLILSHPGPLPMRHPVGRPIAPGEVRTWRLAFRLVRNLPDVPKFVAETTSRNLYLANYYTAAPGEDLTITTYYSPRDPEMADEYQPDPDDEDDEFDNEPFNEQPWVTAYQVPPGEGVYRLDNDVMIFRRRPWAEYLDIARREAHRIRQQPTHHAESFYGFYSMFLAARIIPDLDADMQSNREWLRVFPQIYDAERGVIAQETGRIQDAATLAGILTDRYEAFGDPEDLVQAFRLCTFLMSTQREDGAYYSGHDVHYTAVIYIAKSILETSTALLAQAAREDAERAKTLRIAASALRESAYRALDELAGKLDDIGTEGQMTFEDGMISCSSLQLGLGALRTRDPERQEKYRHAARHLLTKHRALSALLTPDHRVNGATLRFWEAQYAVNYMVNQLNAPMGWSAWRAYASWYLYLLEGKREDLDQTFATLGAGIQLIDHSQDRLRYSFTPDPLIDGEQFNRVLADGKTVTTAPTTAGESYLDMVSDWFHAPLYAWREKWGIDNAVHEVFKAVAEIAAENAFLILGPYAQRDEHVREIGSRIIGMDKGHVRVKAMEASMRYLHVNTPAKITLTWIDGQGKETQRELEPGLHWLPETPESVRQDTELGEQRAPNRQ